MAGRASYSVRWGGRLRLPLAVLCALPALAQSDASGPAFEVASVKVSAPLPPGVMMFRMGDGPNSSDPGRITYRGVTLKVLAARAYGLKEYQVEGPAWLESERYDVIATIPKGSNKEEVGLMLQRLLAERFHLTVHHESKPLAVYTLSVAKGGPKLKEVDPEKLPAPPPPGSAPLPPPPPGPGGRMPSGPMPAGAMRMMVGPSNRTLAGNITIDRLCTMLGNLSDRPVIDLTGLKGTYELNLSWTPDDNPGPTLAQALENNYGLKLEPKKNPADILVIEHADKVPTEN
jgi:uncharacterized protein (TIGR03435 family)